MKVHLSYPIKDMSYASLGDDTVWPFESIGPIKAIKGSIYYKVKEKKSGL